MLAKITAAVLLFALAASAGRDVGTAQRRLLDDFSSDLATNVISFQRSFASTHICCAGLEHTCAVREQPGDVKCWGSDTSKQADVPPAFTSNVRSVTSGDVHSCAITRDNKFGCWGSNDLSTVPEDFRTNVKQANLGTLHTCAVKTNGDLGCWGNNDFNQCSVPDDFKSGIKAVSAGRAFTCALSEEDRQLDCWGDNSLNQTDVPEAVRTTNVTAFSVGWTHSCAVIQNGSAVCWGDAANGKTDVPVDFHSEVGVVSSGVNHTCAIKKNGNLGCWGDNLFKQLDVLDGFKTDIIAVAAGGGHTCAVNADGELACWGRNAEGQTSFPADASNLLGGETGSDGSDGSTDSGSSNVGLIVGLVVGITAGVVLLGALVGFLLYKRRKRAQRGPATSALPAWKEAGKPGKTEPLAYLFGSTANSKCDTLSTTSRGDDASSRPLDRTVPPLESIYTTFVYTLKHQRDSVYSTQSANKPLLDSNYDTSSLLQATSQACSTGAASNDDSAVLAHSEIQVCYNEDGTEVKLGAGTFSKVYKGVVSGKEVALKVINKEACAVQEDVVNILREIAVMKTCSHPNIVQLYGACLDSQQVVMVLQYAPGGDLYNLLRRDQSNTWRWYGRGGAVALDTAKGVEYLHSRNIAHCDLKSGNILIGEDGAAMIADMGMSKHVFEDEATKRGLGTYAWAAPELLLDQKITLKVDVYSFGVILLEICTGQQPQRDRHMPRVPEDCPQEVYNMIEQCLHKDPAQRPTATQVRMALEKVLNV